MNHSWSWVCDLGIASLSGIAAVLWLGSAMVTIPRLNRGGPFVLRAKATAETRNLEHPFGKAMKKQSRLSAAAALCAALAAAFQGGEVFVKVTAGDAAHVGHTSSLSEMR